MDDPKISWVVTLNYTREPSKDLRASAARYQKIREAAVAEILTAAERLDLGRDAITLGQAKVLPILYMKATASVADKIAQIPCVRTVARGDQSLSL